jgi:hypothetical protein
LTGSGKASAPLAYAVSRLHRRAARVSAGELEQLDAHRVTAVGRHTAEPARSAGCQPKVTSGLPPSLEVICNLQDDTQLQLEDHPNPFVQVTR